MVPMDDFFVFGSGRWRGVDTSSGRVEGWGRAKFVVSRGGRLHSVRSRPVLAALRALAEARPSAARAGLPLENKYSRPVSKEQVKGGCEHCKCCHNTRNSNSKAAENKASIAVQCDKDSVIPTVPIPARPLKVPRVSSKRKRDSTSSEDLPPAHKVTTSATVHSYKKPEPKRRRESTKSQESTKNRKESSSSDKREQSYKVGLKRKRQSSSSSEASLVMKTPLKRPVRSLKLRKPGPLNGKRGARESPILKSNKISDEIRRQNKISKYLQPKPTKMRKKCSSDEGNRRTTRQNVSIVLSSNDSDFDVDKRELMTRRRPKSSIEVPLNGVDKKNDESSSDEAPTLKICSRGAMERSTRNKNNKRVVAKFFAKQNIQNNVDSQDKCPTESIKRKLGPKSAIEKAKEVEDCLVIVERSSAEEIHKAKRSVKPVMIEPKPVENHTENGSQGRKYPETSKELLIDERDVDILRLFLQKHYSVEELKRFDTDDEYKKMHFYQINPLVSIERCPRIDRMIRGDSQVSRITLVDFASKLGLRSISEASDKVKRYKTRKREEKSYIIETDSDKDKENFTQPTQTKNLVKEKVLKESMNKDLVKVYQRDNNKGRENNKKIVEMLELNSDEVDQKKEKPPEINKPVLRKTKPTFSIKRGGLKEYSNLEDHAIVSWVSVGGRACCVNGNRLWRELEGQFHKITGRARTWHSLRNRYLRYILPRLDALALPPAQQSRLRAAASAGEIKSRRGEPRRNSIFTLPPRGASSRRPRPPDTPGGDSQTRSNQHTGKSPPTPRTFSPRYSDVIRQFTRTHRTHSNEGSTTKDSQTNYKGQKLSPDGKGKNKPEISKRKSLSLSPRKTPSVSVSKSTELKSRQKLTSASSERKSRHNSPIVSNGRNSRHKSSSSELKSQSPKTSDTNNSSVSDESRNRTNRHSRRRAISTDTGSDSSASKFPERRKSNRHRSLSEGNRRKSNRHQSPSESNRHKSNRNKSPSESNRHKSNRHKSPSESNRHKSNRHNSPSESNKSLSRSNKSPAKSREKSSSESNRHKLPNESNLRKSNRHKSPEPIKRQSIRETDKKTVALPNMQQIRSSPNRLLRSKSPVKPRTRKLFNPGAML